MVPSRLANVQQKKRKRAKNGYSTEAFRDNCKIYLSMCKVQRQKAREVNLGFKLVQNLTIIRAIIKTSEMALKLS